MITTSGKRFPFLASCFPPAHARSEPGFTILELSVVLVIISLVTAMAVTSGIAVIATARQSATVQKMAAIDKALMAFRVANDRIPCPSDLTIPPGAANYGVEAATPSFSTNTSTVAGGGTWSTCIGGTPQANLYSLNAGNSAVAAAEGGVPTVALGLPNDFMYDGWGNHIRYAVDVNMTVTGSFSAMPAGALCGPFTVCDSGSPSPTSGYTGTFPTGSCTNTPRSSAAMYVLMSHGANRFAAYTQSGTVTNTQSDNPNELINCHTVTTTPPSGPSFSPPPTTGCLLLMNGTAPQAFPPVYVQQSPSTYISDVLDSFDDIVTYKERWMMQTAWDRQGTVCPAVWTLVNIGSMSMQKLDMNGNPLFSFSNGGNNVADGSFGSGDPSYISIDNNGNLWAADFVNNRVMEVNSSGQWLMTLGGTDNPTSGDSSNNCSGVATSSGNAAALPGTTGYCGQDQSSCNCANDIAPNPNGMFNSPWSVAVDPGNNIWVADYGNNRVQKFASNGQWLLTIGSASALPGTGNGEFSGPQVIAADASGNIWVGEAGTPRVQKFNSNGQWLLTVGGGPSCTGCVDPNNCSCVSGSTNGLFGDNGNYMIINGVAVDANNNLWVTDTWNAQVQEFSSNGTWMYTLSGPFTQPMGLAFDASGNLWVADEGSGQLMEFSNIGGVWTLQQSINGIAGNAIVSGVAIAR